MTSRQNWRIAGSILVTAALGAVGTEAHALPLFVEVAAIVIGCILIIFGKRAAPHIIQGDSAESPVQLADAGLMDLMKHCAKSTDLQLSASRQYYGRWLQVTGRLDNVSPFSKGYSEVTFQEHKVLSGHLISMHVTDRYQVNRVLMNIVRGTALTITGQVISIGASGIILGKCEIVLIGQLCDDGTDPKLPSGPSGKYANTP
jgi:hypothetical protein